MDIAFHLIKCSQKNIVLAVITGIVSGLGSAALIGLINTELHATSSDFRLTIFHFAGLAVLVIFTQIFSTIAIMRAGQTAARNLRMELSRRIINAPLRLLQQLGAPRLLANLTDDVAVLIESFQLIPQMCINISWVLGCLIYLSWLSWQLFMIVLVIIAFGIMIYHLSTVKAIKPLRVAREQGDALFAHFRGLIYGIKEIKLNLQRRRAFLEDVLYPTAETCRREIISAMTLLFWLEYLGRHSYISSSDSFFLKLLVGNQLRQKLRLVLL